MATKIDYAAVLADLEARREQLDTAISAIKALQEPGAAPKLGRPPKDVRPSYVQQVKRQMVKEAAESIAARDKPVPKPGDLDYDDSANTSTGNHT